MNALVLGTFVVILVDAAAVPVGFLSAKRIGYGQAPPWMMIPHIVNGGRTAANPALDVVIPPVAPPTAIPVAAARGPAKKKPPYQELHRFGSVTNSITFRFGTSKEPALKHASTCWYFLAVLIINCCCLGGVCYGKRLQILCGLVHVLVSLGLLIYLGLASSIFADFFAGKSVGAWCLVLVVWATVQLICGLCFCTLVLLGYDIGDMPRYCRDCISRSSDEDGESIGALGQVPLANQTEHSHLATPERASQNERSTVDFLSPYKNQAPARLLSEGTPTVDRAVQGESRGSADSFSPNVDQASNFKPNEARTSAYANAFRALAGGPKPRNASPKR